MNEAVLNMMLKSLGFDPLKFKADFARCMQQVNDFDSELKSTRASIANVNIKIDLLLDNAGFNTTQVNADLADIAASKKTEIKPTVVGSGAA